MKLGPVLLLTLAVAPCAWAQGSDLTHRKIYGKSRDSIVAIRALAPLGERSGTGTLIDREGLILTSYAVVPEGSTKIRVWTHGPRLYTAELVGTSKPDELSLLRIKLKTPLGPLALGESGKVKVGEVAYTIGNAANSIILDDQPSFNVGIVSGLYKVTEERANSWYKGLVLETTAAVNVGMEGAPLLDAEGKVVGFVTLNYSPNRFLGAAIPIDSQKAVIEKILKAKNPVNETQERGEGFLGLKAKDEDGRVVVTEVEPGGGADHAGIRKGDAIVAMGRQPVRNCDDLWARLKGLQAGDVVFFKIGAGGEVIDVQIELRVKK